eukprot:gnl/MRDRNA2_/MRDRNA2_67761_c0_seq1.p1 gnl/MRDRNA2_/MRDRNA2_67761_c0~~gnl/MRDRNA2_/MRDRNA2_67761_c0_seq1.p1  ORF type:complete len:302 (-),score=53.11 gnl/MRDRNA2_/MRDRNA2_67761_c0_seq1:10-915(-)
MFDFDDLEEADPSGKSQSGGVNPPALVDPSGAARSAPKGGDPAMFDFDHLEDTDPSRNPSSKQAPICRSITGKVEIGNLRAVVTHPEVEGGYHAAILCAGNPGKQFGSAHAGIPLMMRLESAILTKGLTVIRFDYRGVGMSCKDGDNIQKWKIPSMDESHADIGEVLSWAKENISSKILLIGYSYGAAQAFFYALESVAIGYVALSMSTEIWKFFDDPKVQEKIKEQKKAHSKLTVPTLYVTGSKDRLTVISTLQGIVRGRADQDGVTMTTIEGGPHDFKGQESEAGDAVAIWLERMKFSI